MSPVLYCMDLEASKDARQHRFLLQQSKLLTYAVPGTGTEGDVGIGVSLCYPLWQEVVWVKVFRVRVLVRITVHIEDLKIDHAASWYKVIPWKVGDEHCG
jgi:hypothetical protein